MSFKLLQADLSDVEFIHDLLFEEARAGHLNIEIVDEKQQSTLHNDIEYIITAGRRRDENVRAQAIIIEDNGEQVGFVIMSEMFEESGGNELYILVVAPQFRGRGYGSRILDEVLARWLSHSEVFVQCLPASETMYKMLLARGFVHFKTTDDDVRLLRSGGSGERKKPG